MRGLDQVRRLVDRDRLTQVSQVVSGCLVYSPVDPRIELLVRKDGEDIDLQPGRRLLLLLNRLLLFDSVVGEAIKGAVQPSGLALAPISRHLLLLILLRFLLLIDHHILVTRVLSSSITSSRSYNILWVHHVLLLLLAIHHHLISFHLLFYFSSFCLKRFILVERTKPLKDNNHQ